MRIRLNLFSNKADRRAARTLTRIARERKSAATLESTVAPTDFLTRRRPAFGRRGGDTA